MMRVILCTTAWVYLLAGCASPRLAGDTAARAAREPGCTAGEQSTVNELLYFGMSRPAGGVVSQEEWSGFLRDVVTPRFPEGLTAWQASGQWRGNDGRIVREDSYVLQLLHPPDADRERDVQSIAAEYKKRFAQEAVLRVRSHACLSL